MNELRKDYILNRYVIVAPTRGIRPDMLRSSDDKSLPKPSHDPNCPFCPGNEHLLPPIINQIGKDGQWDIRVVPNKFGAVTLEGDPEIKTDNKFYTYAAAYGVHEVIIETPNHNLELEQLAPEQIQGILKTYVWRIKELHNIQNIKYVSVFKNKGKEAGASLAHSHSQVIAFNIKPSWIADELLTAYKYIITHETCPYCEIIQKEKDSHRKVLQSEHFVSFTPYASRFPYEVWIFPQKHCANIVQLNNEELLDLANMMKKILLRLEMLGFPPYNLMIHNAEPTGENFHFYIEISPRLSLWAGLELETGTIINKVSPEEAARFYRGEYTTN